MVTRKKKRRWSRYKRQRLIMIILVLVAAISLGWASPVVMNKLMPQPDMCQPQTPPDTYEEQLAVEQCREEESKNTEQESKNGLFWLPN